MCDATNKIKQCKDSNIEGESEIDIVKKGRSRSRMCIATHTVCKQKINRKMCRVKHIKDKESYLYPVLPVKKNVKYYATKGLTVSRKK